MYNFRYHRFNDKYINLLAYNVSGNWLVLGFHMIVLKYILMYMCAWLKQGRLSNLQRTLYKLFSHQMKLSAELQHIWWHPSNWDPFHYQCSYNHFTQDTLSCIYMVNMINPWSYTHLVDKSSIMQCVTFYSLKKVAVIFSKT